MTEFLGRNSCRECDERAPKNPQAGPRVFLPELWLVALIGQFPRRAKGAGVSPITVQWFASEQVQGPGDFPAWSGRREEPGV